MFEEQFRKQNLPITRYTPQTYDAVWAIAMTLHHTETQRRAKGHASISNFDYSDSHMAHEFLREMARLEFLGVSVRTLISYLMCGRERVAADVDL